MVLEKKVQCCSIVLTFKEQQRGYDLLQVNLQYPHIAKVNSASRNLQISISIIYIKQWRSSRKHLQ